jgi:hypothetical protein
MSDDRVERDLEINPEINGNVSTYQFSTLLLRTCGLF